MPRQQSRDVGYIRASEHAAGLSGSGSGKGAKINLHSGRGEIDAELSARALPPFGTCALTLQPLFPASGTGGNGKEIKTITVAAVLIHNSSSNDDDDDTVDDVVNDGATAGRVELKKKRKKTKRAMLCDMAALLAFGRRHGQVSPASGRKMRLKLFRKNNNFDSQQHQQQQQSVDGDQHQHHLSDAEQQHEVVFWDECGEAFPVAVSLNAAGRPHCPSTFKEFSKNSAIVAVRRRRRSQLSALDSASARAVVATGSDVASSAGAGSVTVEPAAYVYARDAIVTLASHMGGQRIAGQDAARSLRALCRDPVTEDPFSANDDVVLLQDPRSSAARIGRSSLYFMQHNLAADTLGARDSASQVLQHAQVSARTQQAVLQARALSQKREEKWKNAESDRSSADPKSVIVSSVSASATSSGFATASAGGIMVDARIVPKRVTEKGFVRLHTSLGTLDLLLHCDKVPKTCENFLGLCHQGYYNRTTFHRVIPGFCVQGGDPSGTGRGGRSMWGASDGSDPRPFADEIIHGTKLHHSFRGVLSMANHGPDTNTSQFFITFGPRPDLDRKHTVFGRVITESGGAAGVRSHTTLKAIEMVETDDADRPVSTVTLERAQVLLDPFVEVSRAVGPSGESPAQEVERVGNRRETPPSYSRGAGGNGTTALAQQQASRPAVVFKRRADTKHSTTTCAPVVGTGGVGAFLLHRQQALKRGGAKQAPPAAGPPEPNSDKDDAKRRRL